jgi:phosphatidate phosphatase PAH1
VEKSAQNQQKISTNQHKISKNQQNSAQISTNQQKIHRKINKIQQPTMNINNGPKGVSFFISAWIELRVFF